MRKQYAYTICKQYSVKIVFVLLILCTHFSATAQKNKEQTRADSLSQDKKQEQFNRLFIQANLYKNRGEFQEALALYYDCLKLCKNCWSVQYEIAYIYFSQQQYSQAEKYMREALLSEPNKKELNTLALSIYEAWGQPKQHIQTLRKILKQTPHNQDLYYKISELYASQKLYKNAIQELQKLEQKFGVSEKSILLKAKYFALSNNYNSAIKELEKAVAKFPDNTDIACMLGNMYSIQKNYANALRIYTSIEKNPNHTETALMRQAELYIITDNHTDFITTLHKITSLSSIRPETIRYIQNLLSKVPQNSQIQKNKHEIISAIYTFFPENYEFIKTAANYYYALDSIEKSKKLYYECLDAGMIDNEIYSRIIEIETRQKNYTAVYTLSKTAIELYPFLLSYYISHSKAALQLQKYNESITLLNSIQHSIFDNSTLSIIHSFLGYANYKINEHDTAEKHFVTAAEKDRSQYYFKQLYAYYLVHESKNLAYSTNLIETCIEKNPDDDKNRYILARLLFLERTFHEAQTILETMPTISESAEALELLGDILFITGKYDTANTSWQQAIDLGADINIQGKPLLLQKYK